jgi:YVTN family beta-propeller protein
MIASLAASAMAQQFVTIDFPGASATLVLGINNSGVMVGSYIDSSGITHGFSRTNGIFTTIDFPGATLTEAVAINNTGEIIGNYNDSQGLGHGFSLMNGTFTPINDPAFSCPNCVNYLSAVTDGGVIVGVATDTSGTQHGFQDSNGIFTTLDFPGANFTQLLGIPFENANIVGVYSDDFPTAPLQGLLYSGGEFSSFNVPGSSSTSLNGINDGGEVLGSYSASGMSHAFLTTCTSQPGGGMTCSSTVTVVDYPGFLTEPSNLNDGGQVVGAYVDSSNITHGYLMTNGPFAYVANSSSDTVSVIDIPTSTVVNTIAVANGPAEMATSPDGTQVYVTSPGGNTVSVIDTTSLTVVATIAVQSFPQGVAFTPDGTSAYVTNSSSNTVSVIDTVSRTVVATVPVGTEPEGIGMALTSNGTFAYVGNRASNTVSVIAVGPDPAVVQTINVGSDPLGVAVSPNSSLVYVENLSSNNVSVISVATNTVTATIPVGSAPIGAAFSSDSSLAYIVNFDSNTVSVIATGSSSVLDTITGLDAPREIAVTADGSSAYVTNELGNNVSVITTANNTITATIVVGNVPVGVTMASAPATTLQITQPLSPTQPNVFNFGTNNQVVQYPPDTSFSGINMTTAAVQFTQAVFQQRVAGTQFANATCIIYAGSGGNCTDYEVTCSDNNGNPVSCPSEAQPTIAVQTGFTTSQSIVNPGYLTTPIGENEWQNIFTGFSDPTVKGKTKGFSEFVAVSLGSNNPQGLARFTVIGPPPNQHVAPGVPLPIGFSLTSVANGSPVSDAVAGLSVTMITDSHGNPTSIPVLAENNAFKQNGKPGVYRHKLVTTGYALGTYSVTIYGNAFPSYQFQFEVVQSQF